MAWAHSYSITIDHTKAGASDSTNFPLLFVGIYSQLAATDFGGSVTSFYGFDIIFASDSLGASPLSFQRLIYVPQTGAVEFWVKIPTLSHTADTVIYILFGNASVMTDQQSTATWDGTFEGVWHLNAPTPLPVADSTANGNNATAGTAPAASATAKFGPASANFNGSSNYLQVPNSSSLNGWTAQTISCWIKANTGMVADARLLEKGANNEWTICWNYVGGSNKLTVQGLGSTSNLITSSAVLADGTTWHRVAVVITSANLVSLYVDGAFDVSATSVTPSSKTNDLFIGNYGGGGSYYYSGLMQELRIANVARSADWITAEWNNQNSPSTFYSTSLTTSSPSNPWGPYFMAPRISAPMTDAGRGAKHQIVKPPAAITHAPGYSSPVPVASALKGGVIGTAYSETITAQNGTSPYSFAVTSGALPAGMTMSSAGVISGTPTTAATYTFTVTVTDANSYTGSHSFTIIIGAATAAAANYGYAA